MSSKGIRPVPSEKEIQNEYCPDSFLVFTKQIWAKGNHPLRVVPQPAATASLGTCEKWEFMGHSSLTESAALGQGPNSLQLNSPAGDSDSVLWSSRL